MMKATPWLLIGVLLLQLALLWQAHDNHETAELRSEWAITSRNAIRDKLDQIERQCE